MLYLNKDIHKINDLGTTALSFKKYDKHFGTESNNTKSTCLHLYSNFNLLANKISLNNKGSYFVAIDLNFMGNLNDTRGNDITNQIKTDVIAEIFLIKRTKKSLTTYYK